MYMYTHIDTYAHAWFSAFTVTNTVCLRCCKILTVLECCAYGVLVNTCMIMTISIVSTIGIIVSINNICAIVTIIGIFR